MAETQQPVGKGPLPRSLLLARTLVALVFALLAAAFVAETAVLFWEFGWEDGLALATLDSQTFVFFPTFGIVGLFAFWRVIALVVEDSWKSGVVGLVVLGGVASVAGVGSHLFAQSMAGEDVRAMWEIAPEAFRADQGDPAGCVGPDAPCNRAPLREALGGLRLEASRSVALQDYNPLCGAQETSPFAPPREATETFCFASGQAMTQAACCTASDAFREVAATKAAESPSVLSDVHRLVFPIKAFFFFIVAVASVGLLARSDAIHARHPLRAPAAETGLPVGAITMLAWPVMNHAFGQSQALLYGGKQGAFLSVEPLITLGFAAWAIIMIVYYVQRNRPSLDVAARGLGGLAALFGVLRYDLILGVTTRYIGVGAQPVTLIALGVICLFLIMQVAITKPQALREARRAERAAMD